MSEDVNEYGADLLDDMDENAPVNRLNNSHPDGADTIVSPRSVRDRPGRLTTEGNITLHTRQAHKLFYGRRAEPQKKIFPVVGLVRFASNVGSIWAASEADDPYADLALIEIEHEFEDAEKVLAQYAKSLDDLLANEVDGINVSVMHSAKPVVLDLQFFSPWSYQGARLLAKYDKLVLKCLTAKHVGLMFDEDWERVVVRSGTRIRAMFQRSQFWRATGVTRNDIAANNQVAQRAEEIYAKHLQQMLVMPDDVLRGEKRARMAPKVKLAQPLEQHA